MVRVIQRRIIPYILSAILIAASITSLSLWGLRFGIDFTGGSLLEVSFSEGRPSVDEIQKALTPLDLGGVAVQPSGESNVLLRFKHVDEITHQTVVKQLQEAGKGEPNELRFESIGPTIGAELQKQAIVAILVAMFFIVLYIAWAFRKVSRPVASWKYGMAAIIALVHDTLITVGVFSVLGHFLGVEIDGLFVSALLTVIGFSVHDTIVVFDRTRENLFHVAGEFADVVNKSVNETIIRSINTSFTTVLVLTTLYLFGGASIKYFALALIVGIVIGTYSSIFVASPIIVDWQQLAAKGLPSKKK